MAELPNVPLVGVQQEKLLSRMLKESWVTVLVWAISIAFSIGMTYAAMNGKIDSNTQRINAVQSGEEQSRGDVLTQIQNNRQEMLNRMDTMDRKLDDINKYLRDHKGGN